MSLNNFYIIMALSIMIFIYWLLGIVLKRDTAWKKVAIYYLIFASYGFIVYADYRFGISLLMFSALIYILAAMIEKQRRYSKLWVTLGVGIAIVNLGIAKYLNFFLDTFTSLFGKDSIWIRVLVPMGISYYTFAAISYLVDIYRKKYLPVYKFSEFILYMCYFPKFISGPIVRPDRFKIELDRLHRISYNDFEAGIQIIVYGLFKKMVLADHLGVFVDAVFRTPSAYHSATVFLAAISYYIRLYCDFSGYSDMAIGLSKILGIEFDKNFNHPFVSKNVTELWKRWHMSLSSCLQEYLYFSLGGNRKGKIRGYVNLLLTMLICGLWHGASWTFVVWGGLNGVALVVHKIFAKWKIKKYGDKDYGNLCWKMISVCMTFLFASFGFVWFGNETFGQAWAVIKSIIIWQDGIVHMYSWSFVTISFIVIATVLAYKKKYIDAQQVEERYPILKLNTMTGLVMFFTLCGLTAILAYVGNTVFIYDAF